MRNPRPSRLAGLAAVVAVAACVEQAPPPAQAPVPEASSGGAAPMTAAPTAPAPTGPVAHVRVIHASPDPLAATVVVYLDGAQTPVIPGLQFRSAVGYSDVTAGQHVVQVRLPGMPPTTPPSLTWNTPLLQAGHTYTIIAHGLAIESPAVTFASEEDTPTAPDAAHANVRFFHALVGAPAVDVCMAGGTPAFVNVAYGAWGASPAGGHYLPAPAGAATLQIHAHAGAPCAGHLLGTVDVSLPGGANLTAIAIGHDVRRGQGQGVAPQLLACTDAPLQGPSSCTPVALR